MRKVIGVAGVITAACAMGLATPDGASAARLARVGAFTAPTFVTAPRSARPGTIFVVERSGRVIRFHKGSRVTFGEEARQGANVRPRGGDTQAGQPVLEAGTPLGPAKVGASRREVRASR